MIATTWKNAHLFILTMFYSYIKIMSMYKQDRGETEENRFIKKSYRTMGNFFFAFY